MEIVPGDTGQAVDAALEFLRAIARDSVVLANCDMVDAGGRRVPRVRDIGELTIELTSRATGYGYCRPGAVRRSSGALVVIDSVSEVRRDVILPYWDQIAFEILVQVQYGLSSREWHTLMVRPAEIRPEEKGLRAHGWRVSSWRITQWMSH